MLANFRYWFRLIRAFIVRFKAILFAGVIVGLLVFSLLRFFGPALFPKSSTLIGVTGRYHTEELPNEVVTLIGEGLTKIDETGTAIPALAKSWESDDDGKIWTFKIDTRKTWHDGEQVTSADIEYGFEDATIEKPDDETIIFKLNTPFAPFPMVVARPVFKRGLLGTGEWRVSNITRDGEFVSKITLLNDSGKKKVLNFYPSEDSTKLAFQLGEIDEISDLLDPTPFNNWDTVSVLENINDNRFVGVFFNTQAEPFGNNKPFRQALSYAVNKQEFGAPRAISPISPKSWAYNSQVKQYEYDLERAEGLLGNTPKNVLEKTEINLTTSPVLLSTAEKVAKDWEELGIKVNVNVVSILPTDYQAFIAIYHIPRDPDQYAIWHSTQTETNISKLDNPRINTLLENGRLELDRENRKKIYLDFQRFLLEEAPAVFLYHPISYKIVRK